MRSVLGASLVVLVLMTAMVPPAAAAGTPLEVVMRESTELALNPGGENPSPETAPIFGGNLGGRVKHASLSLVLPGWSQLRSGHSYRAAFFLTAEAAIWASFAIFQVQGHQREDRYQEYAVQFAGVTPGERDDNYWRTVGNYRTSEEYNEDRRRDLRVGLDPEGPEYQNGDAWRWQSEARYDEYNFLRRDANGAYDNADFVLVLALVNRLVAFVDAMRSGPPSASDDSDASNRHMLNAGGFGMDLQVAPDGSGGMASSFTLTRGF